MVLSPEEAGRAAWIDFEGNGPSVQGQESPPPTLLGIRIDKEDKFWIVERLFSTCKNRRGSPTGVCDLRELADELIARCTSEGRLIVSWSTHDLRLLMRVLDEQGRERLQSLYRDGKKTARRWNTLYNVGITGGHTLEKYMQRLGWQVPEEIGGGTVGPTLTSLRPLLEEGNQWRDLKPSHRKRWRGIIKHNRHDLKGMDQVVSEAARRIALLHGEHN